MLLHELGNETRFATPDDRSRVYILKGMYPGGSCVVIDSDGNEIQMDGSTVVVVVPLPMIDQRATADFNQRFRGYVKRQKGWN